MRLHNRQIKATFWNDTDLLQWKRDKRWFYEGLIQLADDSGCLEDSPFAFKLILFPSPVDADITVDILDQWRDELIEDGKLVRYSVGKKDYLYLTNFHKHQSLKNPEKPDVPLPPWIQWETYESNSRAGKYVVSDEVLTGFLQQSDNVLPIEIEEKRREREVNSGGGDNAHAREESEDNLFETDQPLTADDDLKAVVREFEACGYGTVHERIRDQLVNLLDIYGREWVINALRVGMEQGRRTLAYVSGILQRWQARGGMTIGPPESEGETGNGAYSNARAGPNGAYPAKGREDSRSGENFCDGYYSQLGVAQKL